MVTVIHALGLYYYLHLIKGTYRQFENCSARVMVEIETGKYYDVRLLEFHRDGRRPGTLMRVHKDKVKFDEALPTLPVNIRLPYKDND